MSGPQFVVMLVSCSCGRRAAALRVLDVHSELIRLPAGWWQTCVSRPNEFASCVCPECSKVPDALEEELKEFDRRLDAGETPGQVVQ
jgi:hypothetical protein